MALNYLTNLLGLRKTLILSDVYSGEIKFVLSDRDISVDTSKEEKHILAGKNMSGELGILGKPSLLGSKC